MDAVKRNCIKVLPHTLVIHLKRFEFDYETMTRWKIKDRYAPGSSASLLFSGGACASFCLDCMPGSNIFNGSSVRSTEDLIA